MNLTDLIYYFTFYSFIGWLIEVTYVSLRKKTFLNRGFLTGPFCIIYGSGAIAVLVFSRLTYADPSSIFLFGMIGLTLMEYITGFLMEKAFGAKWWSYEGFFPNILGRVNIITSVIWGILSLMLVYIVHPHMISFVGLFGSSLVVASLIVVYFIFDITVSVRAALRLKNHVSSVSSREKVNDIIMKLSFGEKRIAEAFPEFISDIIVQWSDSKNRTREHIHIL